MKVFPKETSRFLIELWVGPKRNDSVKASHSFLFLFSFVLFVYAMGENCNYVQEESCEVATWEDEIKMI